jgi:hypothetical protein
MTMGWMETIRYIGLDLQVATVLAVGSLVLAARAFNSAWNQRIQSMEGNSASKRSSRSGSTG